VVIEIFYSLKVLTIHKGANFRQQNFGALKILAPGAVVASASSPLKCCPAI